MWGWGAGEAQRDLLHRYETSLHQQETTHRDFTDSFDLKTQEGCGLAVSSLVSEDREETVGEIPAKVARITRCYGSDRDVGRQRRQRCPEHWANVIPAMLGADFWKGDAKKHFSVKKRGSQ